MEFCSIAPELKKIKKSVLKKNLIFPKMEISSSNIKKFQEMEALKKKKILLFQEMGSLKSFLYFGKWSFSVHFKKISYISKNKNPEKVSYIFLKERCFHISGKGNPPQKILIFSETELSSISGNRNPEKLEVTCKA